MAQIFHPSLNVLAKLSIALVVFTVGGTLLAWDSFLRSDYVTGVNDAVEQPIPFSHRHHVGGMGIDCRYCHHTVEDGRYAGIPSSKVCMTCHSLIWTDAAMLEPMRDSFRNDEPMRWRRVHDLPDFVYFDHSVHIAKGIGCSSCHGEVDTMPLIQKSETLSMSWCLSCHEDPAPFVREREDITAMGWLPRHVSEDRRAELCDRNDVQSLTNCSVCHR